jgi:FkbM family methyltransferase
MLTEVLSKVRNRVQRPWFEWQLKDHLDGERSDLVRLGTAHGGWTIPAAAARSGGTAVCVGAGEDISFDVALNKKGSKVFTLDPTPRAAEHVGRVLQAAKGGPPVQINNSPTDFYNLDGFDESRFTFVSVGVWEENTTKRFFAPKDPNHVSHSIVNLQHTDDYFEAKCETLQTFCASHQVSQIDILKLDIEGAEYAVLGNILESGRFPSILCVEFDEIRNPIDNALMERILRYLDLMAKCGYKFRHIEHSNALFVR